MKPSEKTSSWKTSSEDMGKRLDHFLTERLEGRSRASIQKDIKQGRVFVNEKKASVHRFLKDGDTISYAEAPMVVPINEALIAGLPELSIIEETDDFLVIDKPAGLLVHPDVKTPHGTLVDLILKHDPTIAKVGENPMRPGIVHRLDRDVSGLMLVAKNQNAYDELKRQFAQRETRKTYLAFVYGEVQESEGDIKFRIMRSSTRARMAARPEHETEGRAAWTHYRVLERFHNATLVELEIYSGRTHQIRAHMLALGHPVIGDPLYKPKKAPRNIVAPRLMLQSVGLRFNDPTTGKERDYRLEPHNVFDEMRKNLKESA